MRIKFHREEIINIYNSTEQTSTFDFWFHSDSSELSATSTIFVKNCINSTKKNRPKKIYIYMLSYLSPFIL